MKKTLARHWISFYDHMAENEHVVPIRELRKNLYLSRTAFMKTRGYVTLGNQICYNYGYNCEKCPNKIGCDIAKVYTGNEPEIKRITKILALLYKNLSSPICQKQVIHNDFEII